MDTSLLEKRFKEMGARLVLEDQRWRGFRINILSDRAGEYFSLELSRQENLDIGIVDLRPSDRHLLLMIRELNSQDKQKHKFLCGHDERHWFVAAVPNFLGVKDVPSAMEALKPDVVREQQLRQGVKGSKLKRRKNKAYIRQGEWFFIPVGYFEPPKPLILKNEPIRRGSGKPHMCEFVYRSGGETVYVSSEYPNGLTQTEYNALLHKNPKLRKRDWRIMVRDANVYVKGRVWHPDHATIVLQDWHLVEMNLEFRAPSMRNVAFLD
jgi:hypothetical protein